MNTVLLEFEAIGTSWEIEIDNNSKQIADEKIRSEIDELIRGFDLSYSRFNRDSTIFTASKKVGIYNMPDNSRILFDVYKKLYKITDGLFTPLIGNVLNDAGYDADYSFRSRKVKAPPSWKNSMTFNFPHLQVKKPVLLDFGAAGKGLLVDLIADYLGDLGISSFFINAGGDILAKNYEMVIGLEHPENPNQVIGTVKLNNQSIASSSGNKRKWKEFHHIINPKTLTSPKNILSTWVIAEKSIISDALATSLFLVEPEKLKDAFDFEYLILYPNFLVKKSLHFDAELFYDKSR